jgi:outer membrane lipoprotein-sorting protein
MSLALALALGLTLAPGGGDAGEILKSLEQAGRGLKTMRASFVESKTIVLLDETQESTGEVLLQVPGRLRWNYATPQASAMLIRDGRFARYFPKSKQVFRGPAKGEADLLVGFGPGAAGLGRKYDVTFVGEEQVGVVAAWVLDLKPRSGQSGLFSAIRLWVDKARSIPVQTRLTEPTGDFTVVRFDGVEVNKSLGADAFELKLAKDVVEVQ